MAAALATLDSRDAAHAWLLLRQVRGLAGDSRKVRSGDAFVAWPGQATNASPGAILRLSPTSRRAWRSSSQACAASRESRVVSAAGIRSFPARRARRARRSAA